MQYKNNKAFTLVELIVVITILAILGTIAFISFQGYSKTARDSRRVSDVSNIKTSLELFILNTGNYPLPDNSGEVYYSGDLLWTQGTIGDNVITNLSKNLQTKPLDPLFDIEYTYSISNTKKEYQLMAVYEGELSKINNLLNTSYAANIYKIKVEGTYNEIFLKTPNYIVPVPSIITSEPTPFDLEIDAEKIQSMVLTNGTNFPKLNIPNTTLQTGGLDINLSVYTGSITKDSTKEEKRNVINKIQAAYGSSKLSTKSLYADLLSKTSDEEKEELANVIILKKTPKIVSSSGTQPVDFTKIFDAGSSYTTNWTSNPCSSETINFINVATTDTIPLKLAANTIYKLASGNHIVSDTIEMSDCSAIVGDGDATIFSSVKPTSSDNNGGMIDNYNPDLTNNDYNNIIIAGIKIDGTNDGSSGTHSVNETGICLVGENNTIDNVELFNNKVGLKTHYFYEQSNHLTFTNIKTYDNSSYGIYMFEYPINYTLENITAYNNGNDGLYILDGLTDSSIKNILTYSNSGDGITLDNRPTNLTIDNVESYDNIDTGLNLTGGQNLTMSNIDVYDNGINGFNLGRSDNFTLSNVTAYSNIGKGLNFNISSGGSNAVLSALDIHNNGGNGFDLGWVDSGSLDDVNVYFNGGKGFNFGGGGQYLIISNIEVNNNSGNGFELGRIGNSSLDEIKSYLNTGKGLFFNQGGDTLDINDVEVNNNGGNGFDASSISMSNSTLNNITTYSNTGIGLLMPSGSENYTVSNINSYNNTSYGIEDGGGTQNYSYTNIITHDNGGNGFSQGEGSTNITYNNIDSYNNSGLGINISQNVSNLSMNNIDLYNNQGNGLNISGGPSNFSLIGVKSYNNSGIGIILPDSCYDITFNDVESHNNSLGGIYLLNSPYLLTLDNVDTYSNNGYGLFFGTGGSEITANGINSYSNTLDGILMPSASNSDYTNIKTYNNGYNGLKVTYGSNTVSFDNLKSFNNAQDGIYLDDGNQNIKFINIALYNNTGNGYYSNKYSSEEITNALIYNNSNGIVFTDGSYAQINNTQIFNNSNYGVIGVPANNRVFNNVQSYNNGNSGFQFSDYVPWLRAYESTSINKVSLFDNGVYGLKFVGGDPGDFNRFRNNYYYGNFKLFGNTSGNSIGAVLANDTSDLFLQRSTSANSTYGFAIGNLDETSGTNMKTIPSTSGWNSSIKGKQTGLTFTGNETYSFQSNVPKQIKPIQELYGSISLYGTDGVEYDTTQYIGEF